MSRLTDTTLQSSPRGAAPHDESGPQRKPWFSARTRAAPAHGPLGLPVPPRLRSTALTDRHAAAAARPHPAARPRLTRRTEAGRQRRLQAIHAAGGVTARDRERRRRERRRREWRGEEGKGGEAPARTKASGRKGRVRRARWQPCPQRRLRPSGAAPTRAWSATAEPFLRRRRISASRSSSATSTSRVRPAGPLRAR